MKEDTTLELTLALVEFKELQIQIPESKRANFQS